MKKPVYCHYVLIMVSLHCYTVAGAKHGRTITKWNVSVRLLLRYMLTSLSILNRAHQFSILYVFCFLFFLLSQLEYRNGCCLFLIPAFILLHLQNSAVLLENFILNNCLNSTPVPKRNDGVCFGEQMVWFAGRVPGG